MFLSPLKTGTIIKIYKDYVIKLMNGNMKKLYNMMLKLWKYKIVTTTKESQY